jgi:hypothetical protein
MQMPHMARAAMQLFDFREQRASIRHSRQSPCASEKALLHADGQSQERRAVRRFQWRFGAMIKWRERRRNTATEQIGQQKRV